MNLKSLIAVIAPCFGITSLALGSLHGFFINRVSVPSREPFEEPADDSESFTSAKYKKMSKFYGKGGGSPDVSEFCCKSQAITDDEYSNFKSLRENYAYFEWKDVFPRSTRTSTR